MSSNFLYTAIVSISHYLSLFLSVPLSLLSLSLSLAEVTHYCALLLPQRPEFTDFGASIHLNPSSPYHLKKGVGEGSKLDPSLGSYGSKRQICDVNSFDCEDSDGEEERSIGYKTPQVDELSFNSSLSLSLLERSFSPPLFTVVSSGRLCSNNEFCGEVPGQEARGLRCENQSTRIDTVRDASP
jgi:hypothetical protein